MEITQIDNPYENINRYFSNNHISLGKKISMFILFILFLILWLILMILFFLYIILYNWFYLLICLICLWPINKILVLSRKFLSYEDPEIKNKDVIDIIKYF